jgi:hypothetical protein
VKVRALDSIAGFTLRRAGGVLKRAAITAEEDGKTIDDTDALYQWALTQRDLLEPLRTRRPPVTCKVPIVRRYVHLLSTVDQRDVHRVKGSDDATSIIPFNLGKRVLFQRLACRCAACLQTEPDTTGCTYPHLTCNIDKKIVLLD